MERQEIPRMINIEQSAEIITETVPRVHPSCASAGRTGCEQTNASAPRRL